MRTAQVVVIRLVVGMAVAAAAASGARGSIPRRGRNESRWMCCRLRQRFADGRSSRNGRGTAGFARSRWMAGPAVARRVREKRWRGASRLTPTPVSDVSYGIGTAAWRQQFAFAVGFGSRAETLMSDRIRHKLRPPIQLKDRFRLTTVDERRTTRGLGRPRRAT